MRSTLGGNITVITQDLWYTHLRAGRAFSLGARQAAGAGVLSHVQLINPAGSTVIVLVRSARGNLSAQDQIDVRLYNVNCTTDVGPGVNLLSGGAAAQAHVRIQQNAAALGARIALLGNIAWDERDFSPSWLAELGAGEGILITHVTANLDVVGNFQWVEV